MMKLYYLEGACDRVHDIAGHTHIRFHERVSAPKDTHFLRPENLGIREEHPVNVSERLGESGAFVFI